MKITNISNFVSYKNNSSKVAKNDVVKSKNYDTIQINKNNMITAESNDGFDIEKMKSKIVSEVNSETGADMIAQMKQQISNNVYAVNPEELAKIMLSI